MSEFKYVVKDTDAGLQIKDILRREFRFSARLRTKMKQNNCMYLNGKNMIDGKAVRGWQTPNEGDVLEVRFPLEISDFEPEDIPFDVIFEDDDLLIINKPAGFVVHPTKGQPSHTIANGLMKYILDTGQSFKIRFVNRLDMNTSGLLIVAKNAHVQENLIKQMKSGTIKKKYTAVVKGILPEDKGTIDAPLGRPDPDDVRRGVVVGGKESVTHFTVLERLPAGCTLVELVLETGRTHQIRVHMSHIGFPLVGDHLYGSECPELIARHALHAGALTFLHPVSGSMIELSAPLPDDMKTLLSKLANG
ncbi:MAG: RluA family pseudouridine synthase [Clostridia bacterium]|nr:RluA family pseudouridine synthase [Clostridia bacterium]